VFLFENYDSELSYFPIGEKRVASSADAAKGFGGKDDHTPMPPLLREPPADIGCGGSIDRDAVCGMLTECLQDVSPAILAMPHLFICC
jgi:hypothetical protein